jgi:Icc-related predicted phosphoesterase
MLITSIADTHELHREVYLPKGDLLIHAGDITLFSRRLSVLRDFNAWLAEVPDRYKVVVPGNHDTLLELPEIQREITNAHLLINSGVVLGGLKIWGSPVTHLRSGAFAMYDELERAKIWDLIPTDTDVLVTHIPPAGILDWEQDSSEPVGCKALRRQLRRVRVKLHVFGHVHQAGGNCDTEGVRFINAALTDSQGDLIRDPICTHMYLTQRLLDPSSENEFEADQPQQSYLV